MSVNEPFVYVIGCFDVDLKNNDVNVSLLFDFVVIVNGEDVVVLEGFPTIFVDIDFVPVVLAVVIFFVDVVFVDFFVIVIFVVVFVGFVVVRVVVSGMFT